MVIAAFIVASEIGFWVLLLAGLATRYLLRRPRLGAGLLLCVPLVDLVLLLATVLDLRAGATAEWMHGLAAVYVGFSVAFGHSVIRWADQRFAHRFAGGPPPARPPRHGTGKIRHEWREWGKAVLGAGISSALLLAGVAIVDDAERSRGLLEWIRTMALVVGVWAIWPVSYTIWPPRPKD